MTKSKPLALLSVSLAAISMPLAFTGPAVALRAISHDLGGNPVELNWATNAFMLTFGSGLMAAGALADSFGRKRVFLAGTVGVALMSLLLAFSGSLPWFDLMRAAQGVAAALAFSAGMAALAQEFDGRARIRAFSIIGTSFGAGLTVGPIASGMMIDLFGWRSVFLLVVALTGAATLLGAWCLRDSKDPDARGVDWPGAIAFTGSLTAFTSGVLQGPQSGWGHPLIVSLLAGSVLLMAAFVVIERRSARPMLDLSLFRYSRFVGVQLLAAAPAYAFVVLLILLPIRFIGIDGLGETAGGQMMIALSAPLLVLPLVAGWLSHKLEASTICGAGLVLSAAGLFWLSHIPIEAGPSAAILPMLTIGVGISFPWGLMDGLAVSVVPKERAGMAAGIFSTTRVAGEGLALAIVTTILSGLTSVRLGPGGGPAAQRLVTGDVSGAASLLPGSTQAALIGAYGDAFGVLLIGLMGVTLVTALIVFLSLGRGERSEPAAETSSF